MPFVRGAGRRAPAGRRARVVVAACAAAALVGCDVDAPGQAPRQPTGPQAASRAPAAPDPAGTGLGPPLPGGPAATSARPPRPSSPVLTGRPGTPAGGAPPAPSAVDGRDAVAVSRTVVAVTYTMDTAIDASGWDAAMRAGPYLAPDYLAALRDNPPDRGPGGEWFTWSAHQAYTTVELASADETGKPEDTALRAYHAWNLTVTATGRDGWTARSPDRVVYVVLARDDGTADWKVTQVRVG